MGGGDVVCTAAVAAQTNARQPCHPEYSLMAARLLSWRDLLSLVLM